MNDAVPDSRAAPAAATRVAHRLTTVRCDYSTTTARLASCPVSLVIVADRRTNAAQWPLYDELGIRLTAARPGACVLTPTR